MSGVLSEPFASKIDPARPYDVIIEIALDASAVDRYASLDARYAQVEAAVTNGFEMAGEARTIAAQTRPAIAPYVFATLNGSEIATLAADAALPIASIAPTTEPRGLNRAFDPQHLLSEVIAEPLATNLRRDPNAYQRVIVHLSLTHTSADGRAIVLSELGLVRARSPGHVPAVDDTSRTHPYVFAELTGYAILALVDLDRSGTCGMAAIYHVWEDSALQPLITESISTVKADAANVAYAAAGKGIVWAILDSGVDAAHPHFAHFDNLNVAAPLGHRDLRTSGGDDATVDPFGHGTHVAGIVAGAMSSKWDQRPVALIGARNEAGVMEKQTLPLDAISGMAAQCSLVSLRVLEDDGSGNVSALLNAIDLIQQWNGNGRHLLVHGVNLSVGYPFEAEWFACGATPLCVEIDRLVNSGVVVVVAAGNSGYGFLRTEESGAMALGIGMSINDPGNSALAITVGSTHRTEPHTFGVSYFSSKGPTGDGRAKPDVVAPGERIISCASKQSRTAVTVVRKAGNATSALAADDYAYREDSGTSMSAPHVSGIIAAFLSIRKEYIGRPRDVKALFMSTATDLGRDRSYQGAGLVDLMRAIQSV